MRSDMKEMILLTPDGSIRGVMSTSTSADRLPGFSLPSASSEAIPPSEAPMAIGRCPASSAIRSDNATTSRPKSSNRYPPLSTQSLSP